MRGNKIIIKRTMTKRIKTVAMTALAIFVVVGGFAGKGECSGNSIVYAAEIVQAAQVDLLDGTYEIAVTLSGGSGKASVASPAEMVVTNGQATARIVFSSPNYDYMRIGEQTYYPVNTEGNSTFEIPITVFDADMQVIADTVAMSTPHEITYQLYFDSSSLPKETNENSTGEDVLAVAGYGMGAVVGVIVICGAVIYWKGHNKKNVSGEK